MHLSVTGRTPGKMRRPLIIGSAALVLLFVGGAALWYGVQLGPPAAGCYRDAALIVSSVNMVKLASHPDYRIRLITHDGPDTWRPACEAEARLADQAAMQLRSWLAEFPDELCILSTAVCGWERPCAYLAIRIAGDDWRDVGILLRRIGYAVPRTGEPPDWCAWQSSPVAR